jgi:selenocysteine-specific elongation factor
MKHLIMGTAGHIDHGKTALIKALTNIDCDTHTEEKKRGITINLGFAHLDLPRGGRIGIVDVPGHRDFVHTMVGGAAGIDIVLLVIAADSGVMPQTREHLQIMNILGVKAGIIALTKVDLVEESDLLEIPKKEIRKLVKGTFLENSPLVEVSAKTNQGIETLKDEITQILPRVEEKSADGLFRMFIDRIFTISGFGTVVTGSVMSGQLKVKDKAFLLPGKGKELIVRRLERHGQEISEIKAGDRASINLSGLSKKDFNRGMIISGEPQKSTDLLDARFELFEKNIEFGIWTQVIFHTGTYENQARIHLIDKNKLRAGEKAMVQIHLQSPCVLRYGDRFVIRNSSSDITLGGGIVIDANPLLHRRRPEELIRKMTSMARGHLPDLIIAEVKKYNQAITSKEIAFNLNTSVSEIERLLAKKLPDNIIIIQDTDGMILMTAELKEKYRQGIFSAIEEFKNENPYIQKGISLSEIRARLGIEIGSPSEVVLKQMLEYQQQKGHLIEKDKTWMLPEALEQKEKKLESHLKFFSELLKGYGMQTPVKGQLIQEAKKRNLSEKELKQILSNLTSSGEVYRIKDEYIHAYIVNSCREKLKAELIGRKQGITVAEFRDLVGGNRKICLLLLAQYDSELLTKRAGDFRILVKNEFDQN